MSATLRTNPVGAPYAPGGSACTIDLHLDANEGPGIGLDLGAIADRVGREGARRYPRAGDLERVLGDRFGVPSECVVVTAGGDDAIDRVCRAMLAPGAELILPTPTFEMIPRYATLAGAEIVTVPWESCAFPADAVVERISRRTRVIAVVSPNNPTGAVATAGDLERVARSAPDAVVLVDLAYAEYADADLTRAALALPNTVVIRTFSKAYGLAGIRVGFAMGSAPIIRALRAAGAPFPVSGVSLGIAREALERGDEAVARGVAMVRRERGLLADLLAELGAAPRTSHGNFVLAEYGDAAWVCDGLAGLGIGVRRFGRGSGLERALRITCPGDADAFDRVCAGLRSVIRPRALLLDMDGVVADVSGSYRRAIAEAAASFGVEVTAGDIAEAKARGDANNDWALTHRFVTGAGVSATLAEVTARFERIYQGTPSDPGLRATESVIPARATLERLASRVPLGIVTGRPRVDCDRFLREHGIADLFRVRVCMEDAPPKPDPSSVALALHRMGVTEAWMVGDTPDDIVAARGARVVPVGIVAPGLDAEPQRRALERAGAARVLTNLSDLEELLP